MPQNPLQAYLNAIEQRKPIAPNQALLEFIQAGPGSTPSRGFANVGITVEPTPNEGAPPLSELTPLEEGPTPLGLDDLEELYRKEAKEAVGKGDFYFIPSQQWDMINALPLLQKHILQELARRDGELRFGPVPLLPQLEQLERRIEMYKNALPEWEEDTIGRMERGLSPMTPGSFMDRRFGPIGIRKGA